MWGEEGVWRKNAVLGNALVDMYARCGEPMKAQQVFDERPSKNTVSWNVLVSGYAQHGQEGRALECMERMRCEGISPQPVAFLAIAKACGSIGAVEKGSEMHAKLLREGLLEDDNMLGTAVMDMYARCGMLAKAEQVFEELPHRNVVSWTALMAGYGRAGEPNAVFGLFKRMTGEGIEPNVVTFTVVLNACSFSGLAGEGQSFLEAMSMSYGIVPAPQHRTCMIDLLGRLGHLEEASAVIKRMPAPFDHLPAWYALLGSCKASGNRELGLLAFENAVKLDERSAGAYVCMSDLYAATM
jgi:pentatricopeptide repeat protein